MLICESIPLFRLFISRSDVSIGGRVWSLQMSNLSTDVSRDLGMRFMGGRIDGVPYSK